MRERSQLLRDHIHALLDAGVRRPVTREILAESLGATVGEAAPIRRAKAFAHLLDRTEQVVLPHELLAGSILGLWPLAEGLPSYEERLGEARGVVQAYVAGREAGTWRPKEARWALMARDHYEASVNFDDLEQMTASIAGGDTNGDTDKDTDRGTDGHGEMGVSYAEVFRELEKHFVFGQAPAARKLLSELPWFASNHLHLRYEKALDAGLAAMRDDVAARMAAAGHEEEAGGTLTPQSQSVRAAQRTEEAGGTPAPQLRGERAERPLFYESVLIALDATIRFIGRYARTLEGAAAREAQPGPAAAGVGSPERAEELRAMAAVCDRMAVARPATFREAIQLVWMLHLVAHIGDGSAMSLGRFDQYLGPFLERDLAAGRITRVDAQALVECLWLKVNEPKMRTVQSLCLGGLRPDGADGTNELTYVCLDACAAVREPYPNTAVRVHAATPEALWDKIVATLASGVGHPMLFNDGAMLAGLARAGLPERDAREYYPMGCVEVMLAGMQPTYQGAGSVVFPDAVLSVLKSGGGGLLNARGAGASRPLSTDGKPIDRGRDAPAPLKAADELAEFDTFEKFLAACVRQIEHQVRASIAATEQRARQARPERTDPFASAFVEGCIESSVDVCRGGARYSRIYSFGSLGFGTAVDSLSAVKTFVYDQRRFGLSELAAMLDRDFVGDEPARALLARATPAFGNDAPDADAIAERLFAAFTGAILGYRSEIGATYLPQSFSYHSHVRQGELTPATPNGRRRGATLSDSLGPSQGCDTSGPTCLIHSMTRLDGSTLTGGCAFNLKIASSFVRGQEGRRVLASLLRTYIAQGGMQVQVNVLDQETLRRAQAEPEHHRNLIVRVAGYSEYFTALDRKLQDEIIARTAHQE